VNAYFLGFNFRDSVDVKMRSTEIHKISTLSQLKRVGEEEEKVLCINGASDSSIEMARVGSIAQEARDEKTHVVVVRDDKNHFKEFEREMAFIDGPSLKSNEIVANFISMVRTSIQKFVGNSAGIIDLKSKIFNTCFSDRNFFITGENGSGKHLLSEVVHGAGLRSSGPFIFFNGGDPVKAIADSDSGHLFIEEVSTVREEIGRTICELDLIHAKGGPDVKIISSAGQKVDGYGFTCLDEIVLRIPPLRERKSDISLLADHFLRSSGCNFCFENLPFEMQDRLVSYNYPGNVRELKEIIAKYLSTDHSIQNFQDLFILSFISNVISNIMNESKTVSPSEIKRIAAAIFEKNHIDELFKSYKWDEEEFYMLFDSAIKNLGW